MPTRRVLKGVLRSFLGTYCSRYSDYDGYSLFGFLVNDLSLTEIDLLNRTEVDHDARGPWKVARMLARHEFQDQLAKFGFPVDRVASARLLIERLERTTLPVEPHERVGFNVRFRAIAIADKGAVFVDETTIFIAPHDARLERRSAR